MDNPRESLATVLQPEPGHFDSRQLGAEITFRGNKNLHMRRSNCRLIRLGIGKSDSAAPSHDSNAPYLRWNSLDSGQAAGNAAKS
jgi:hypothetical protein